MPELPQDYRYAQVGFIGLGMMGRAMAERLVANGQELVVYNRTSRKAEALAARWGTKIRVAASPREVAEQAQVVISMVTDDQAAADIVQNDPLGMLSALGPQHIWIDCSTVSPGLSQALAQMVAGCGAVRLEAPVAGSVDAAEAGRLVMFVGGPEVALDHVRPLLSVLAERVARVGNVGQATALKLATNLNVAIQVAAFGEALTFAETWGIARQEAVALMLGSVIASPMLKYRVPFALDPPAEPWFTVRLMLKDLNLTLSQAMARGTALPVTGLTADLLRLAVNAGAGDQELAGLINQIRAMAYPKDGD